MATAKAKSWDEAAIVDAYVHGGANYDDLRERFGIRSNDTIVSILRRNGVPLRRARYLAEGEAQAVIDGQRELIDHQDRELIRLAAENTALRNENARLAKRASTPTRARRIG